jgi:gliding motility-associated-like protein
MLPGQTSLSNKTCRMTVYPPVPQWNYVRTATLTDADHILVVDSVDVDAYTRRLALERSYNGGPWEEVASMPGGTGPVVSFTDADVNTADRSYSYRVAVEDSCGARAVTSNIGTSILLTATADLDGFDHLRWNGYEQWAGTVAGYTVYRSLAGGPFVPVGGSPATIWEFADNVQGLSSSSGDFCYYVVAAETGDPAGIDASSDSNIASAVQHEEVWVPNAFIEGGYNNTFKPVLAYADVDRYEFTIFNRWGQQIWTTKDRDRAWDGRVDGTIVPQGVYAWYCSFLNGAGKTVERRGTVTFLPGL